MIVSAQRFRFKPEVTEPQRVAAMAAIVAVSRVESVAFAVVGQDLGDPADGYTHGYLVGIPDLAALARYFDDPVHAEGDRVFLPLVERLSGTGLSDDEDPALREKIVALHARRVERDPEYAALLAAIPQSALLHEGH